MNGYQPLPITSRLQLCLDTADRVQWQQWFPLGLFHGVTTNPLLLERAGVACTLPALADLAHQALDWGVREVQLQTWGQTVDALVSRGQQLAEIAPQVVVKVPVTQLGTKAAAILISKGLRVTLTGVYTAHQVLVACALGAEYAAPYLGRINDLGGNGREELVAMQRAIVSLESPLRLLVASIRSVEDMAYLATQGLDTFTFSPTIAAALFQVDATNQAAEDFEQAAQRMGEKPLIQ